MKVHFIAIGGSAMHNLAISLKIKGCEVSGSDDEIFDPAASRLKKYGIFPDHRGWDARCITPELDAVILGMHAREDNPELQEARRLGLKIYSYPEFIYEQSKDKTRIVVGGSHGKTTITSMILHVMNRCGLDCDYMIGAQLQGFEVMTRLSEDAPYIVIEGDEYLTSALDRRPKFHVYRPDIGIISGIAWDHVNVFPTFENYVEQFRIFASMIPENGRLIYCGEDENCCKVAESGLRVEQKIGYTLPDYAVKDGKYEIHRNGKTYPLLVFGHHNLLNICAAYHACSAAGISDDAFFTAMQSFPGASNRLECLYEDGDRALYRDFAHSPSKLKATIAALKEKDAERHLVACMELHTYSSLTESFLQQYAHTMDAADEAIVYFNPHAIALKKLPPITEKMIFDAFKRADLKVFSDSKALFSHLKNISWKRKDLLMMSSGNYDGMDVKKIFE